MRWQLDTKRQSHVWRQAVGRPRRPAPEHLSADGPQVCLLYEGEAERDELVGRLQKAGLDELCLKTIDLGLADRPRSRLGAMPHSLTGISQALGAGTVVALGSVSSHWMLIGALMLTLGPLFLILRLVRRSAHREVVPSH